MNIDKKYVELINREIDGLNSEKESAALKAFLAQNPLAQTLFRELNAVSEKLGEVNAVEPPEHLMNLILNSIPKQKYVPVQRKGFMQSLAGIFTLQPRYQLALAFSGGLAAGLLLFALFISASKLTSPDPANLYGTLVLRDFSEKIPVADQLEFTLEQIQGIVLLKSSGKMLVVEMDIRTQAGIEIFFEFNKKDLSFAGFFYLDETAKANISIDEQKLKFIPQSEDKIRILLTRKTFTSASLKVSITKSGNVLYEKKLVFSKILD